MAFFRFFPGISYFSSSMIGLGSGFLWYIFKHRQRLLFHFHYRYEDAILRLEKYAEAKQKHWEDSYLIRISAVGLLGLAMLLLLFFQKDSLWTKISVSLFISLILALSIKGWMDFNDAILLHDIRRSERNQPSE